MLDCFSYCIKYTVHLMLNQKCLIKQKTCHSKREFHQSNIKKKKLFLSEQVPSLYYKCRSEKTAYFIAKLTQSIQHT
jgi:hypothetical protein